MLLTPVAKVREVYSFADLEDSNKAFEAALHAAEPYLAARMRMPSFARLNVTDTFFVAEPTYQQGSHFKTEFLLSRGMVSSVTTTHRAETIANVAMPGFYTAVTPSFIDYEKGIIRDLSWAYAYEYVQVTYVSGFEADGTNATMYRQDQVPDWLKEAAVTYAMIMLAGTPTLKEAEIKTDTKALTRTLDHVIGQHQRYAPGALLPL